MKKLKYLLIPLFSLLFMVKVNALTSDYNVTLSYDANFYNNYVIPNQEKIDNLKNYLQNELFPILINQHQIKTNRGAVAKIYNLSNTNWNMVLMDPEEIFSYYDENDSSKRRVSVNKTYGYGGFFTVYFNQDNTVNSLYLSYVPDNVLRYNFNDLNPLTNNVNIVIDDAYYIYDLLTDSASAQFKGGTGVKESSSGINIPIRLNGTDTIYQPNSYIPLKTWFSSFLTETVPEPTYTYTTTVLENGNVRLDISLQNYNENSGYGIELENMVTNEEYGITNPYSDIFPNIIPYGNTYSVELSYDTYLILTLYQYEQVEDTNLYIQEEISSISIDINETFLNTNEEPYFTITKQTKNTIEGKFVNTTSSMECGTKYYDQENFGLVDCNEIVGFNFHENGYAEVAIKKNNNIIYSRKINFLGGSLSTPYLVYDVTKRDFYSVINWYVENNISNLTYRYSLDNGNNFSSWATYNENANNSLSVFDNNTIIIEIANSDQSTIYDSKAISVINDVANLNVKNGSIGSLINKFNGVFDVNGNILNTMNIVWTRFKYSNLYLIIFIPFITGIISSIIYLIRRK